MKWVKKNIAAFGGNPNNITLFGQGGGSVCVSAHTLSPESWDYFDRVILESGNMLMYWSLSQTVCMPMKTLISTTACIINYISCHVVFSCIKIFFRAVLFAELEKFMFEIKIFREKCNVICHKHIFT